MGFGLDCNAGVLVQARLEGLLVRKRQGTYLLLEPFHSIFLGELMLESNFPDFPPSVSNIESGSAEDNIKVETIDTNARIVLDAQVDVFLNAETEVARVGEVLLSQFVLTDLAISTGR